LDTLDPGQSAEIRFAVSGLSKGDWNESDIFFRGNGEIIGATRIDEKLLDEMRKMDALAAAEAEHAASRTDSIEHLVERTPTPENEELGGVLTDENEVVEDNVETAAIGLWAYEEGDE